MKSILDIISPIHLCHGHNPNTALTGVGCLLDICSYLNGDEVITDKTKCVDEVIRPMAAMVNDHIMGGIKRDELIKFIPRLMASAETAEQERAGRLVVLDMFRSSQEAMICRVRDIVGLRYAPWHYAEYLKAKRMVLLSNLPADMYPMHTQTAIQYSLAIRYLNQAEIEADQIFHKDLFQAVSTQLREKAVKCLDALLGQEVLIETPTHLDRARGLLDIASRPFSQCK
jgi:hypothetical protein